MKRFIGRTLEICLWITGPEVNRSLYAYMSFTEQDVGNWITVPLAASSVVTFRL